MRQLDTVILRSPSTLFSLCRTCGFITTETTALVTDAKHIAAILSKLNSTPSLPCIHGLIMESTTPGLYIPRSARRKVGSRFTFEICQRGRDASHATNRMFLRPIMTWKELFARSAIVIHIDAIGSDGSVLLHRRARLHHQGRLLCRRFFQMIGWRLILSNFRIPSGMNHSQKRARRLHRGTGWTGSPKYDPSIPS